MGVLGWLGTAPRGSGFVRYKRLFCEYFQEIGGLALLLSAALFHLEMFMMVMNYRGEVRRLVG